MARRAPTFSLFITVVTTVIALAHFYLWARLLGSPAWPAPVPAAGGAACAALALLTPAGIMAGRMMKPPLGRWLAASAYIWFGCLWMLFAGVLLSEPVRLGLALGGVEEPLRSRGIALALALVCGLALVWGVPAALFTPSVRRVRMPLRRWPESMTGFKLVQLSDIHIGPTLGRRWLEKVVARVNELEPDVVAITGDLVDGSVERLAKDVAPLGDLRARHGVYFVTGNHEYYSGADEWCAELERLGIKVLRNEHVAVEAFDLAGVDDWNAFGKGHRADLARALEGRDADRPAVLLAHQPRQADEARDRGVDLVLSGHTHGGQIFPWHPFVRLQQPYLAGVYQLDPTVLYVSRGTGYWGPPLRVAAPAEITLLELHPKNSDIRCSVLGLQVEAARLRGVEVPRRARRALARD